MEPLSTSKTIVLGAVAGSTIFLGLPLGRLRDPSVRLKAFLNAISAGILLFLLIDIIHNATEPLEDLVVDRSWGHFARLAPVYVAGLFIGLMTLVYESRVLRRRTGSKGPGAMAVGELAHPTREAEAKHLGMLIAAGIGLHNFSEGLAIGQSAHAGEISLALLLVIGFALHNMTEGFGIIGPLAGAGVRGSWGYLLLAGVIGGGPTFIGTVIGISFINEYLFVGFLALAGGAIIYVIAELLNVGRKLATWQLTMWGVLVGFLVGLATELIVVAAGV